MERSSLLSSKPLTLSILTTLTPALSWAGQYDFSLSQIEGSSEYFVESESQELTSKLIFPYRFATATFRASDSLWDGSASFEVTFPISSFNKKGEDYDWQNKQLTVYSSSQNNLENFFSSKIQWKFSILKNLQLVTSISYDVLDFSWIDTYQKDYVKNETSFKAGRTLSYKQSFYLFELGCSYTQVLSQNSSIELLPKIALGYAETKDQHLLRGFYTLHESRLNGLNIEIKNHYQLNKTQNFSVGLAYKKLIGKTSKMNYYSIYNENVSFASYPAKFSNESITLGLTYSIKY